MRLLWFNLEGIGVMSKVTSQEFLKQIQQVIQLPEHCRRVHIEFGVDSAPVVTAEFLASAKDGLVTKRFSLVELDATP